ncbi:MAG: ATP-binding protein [Litoreibacter sp.]
MLPPDLANLGYVAAPVFAVDIQAGGEPIYSAANPATLAYSGLALDAVLGKTAREVSIKTDGNDAVNHHLHAIEIRETHSYQVEFRDQDGALRRLKTTLTPVFDEHGNVHRLIGTSVSLEDTKHKTTTPTATHIVPSEVEDFISMAAHDLRTPMRNVQHIADMLRDDLTDVDHGKSDLIDLLEDIAVKTTDLISDVLSHAQATRVKDEDTTFDLKTLVREVHTVLDPLHNHAVNCAHLMVFGNKAAFQIVLRNLLDNAFKHGGKKHLSLSIRAKMGPSNMIEVTVRDDGAGFDNPGVAFLNSGKMRVDSGFGLLGICRLIRARQGDIVAEIPENGVGSLIRLTLPGRLTHQNVSTQAAQLADGLR